MTTSSARSSASSRPLRPNGVPLVTVSVSRVSASPASPPSSSHASERGHGSCAARCLSYGEGITFWAIAEIVRELIGIEEDHSIAEARALIDAHTERMSSGPAVAATLAQLLGLADGAATLAETAWAIRQVLVAHAADRRSSWWSTTSTGRSRRCSTCSRACRRPSTDAPILVLCLPPRAARAPPRLARRPAARSARGPGRDALVDSLLGGAPASVRERLGRASAGNPLFAEELVAMLARRGRPASRGRRCTIEGDLDALHLPPSLHALLGARLDRLDPESRATLERGAIDGEVFHRGAVVELSEPSRRPSVPAASRPSPRRSRSTRRAELRGRGRLPLQAHPPARHRLPGDRQRGSRLAARAFSHWLERHRGRARGGVEEIVGYHLEQSYRCWPSSAPIAEELGRSAIALPAASPPPHTAPARAAIPGALRLFTTAAELSSTPADRARYTLLQGTVAREAMQYRAATEALTRVRADAAKAGWPGARGSAPRSSSAG